jgi:hypothetical protein
VAAVVERGLVDLPDRRRRDRHGVERLEDLVELLAVLALEDLLHVLERDLRGGVAQLGQLGLELLAVLLGHQADVEERQDLPDLHRGALHRPEHGDDLLGRLDLAALERGDRLLVGSRDVGGARAELPGRLPGRQAPDGREPPDAGGRDRILLARQGGDPTPWC